MSSSRNRLQALYEISLSIDTAFDLYDMLGKTLATYLKYLKCSRGSVLKTDMDKNGIATFSKVHSTPQQIENNENYLQAIDTFNNLYKSENSLSSVLPFVMPHSDGQTSYIMDLPQFGLLYLSKEGNAFDDSLIDSLQPLNNKFANACHICSQNQIQNTYVEKYRGIFESIQDVYAEVEASSGIITEISPSIESMSGYTRDEMIGQDITRYFVMPKQLQKLIDELYTTGSSNNFEAILTNRTGFKRTVSFSVLVLKSDNDNPTRIVGTMRDITDSKQIRDQLSKSEQNQIIVNYFATSLLGSNTVNDILWDITYNCISKMEFTDCIVYLFNDDRTELVQRAAYGSNKEKDYDLPPKSRTML
jgi:PAS domain S-box-containing protein